MHHAPFLPARATVLGLILGGLAFGLRTASAQDFPQPTGHVNDFARVISPEAAAAITALCREVEEKTGAEIAVVTVATVGDYDYFDYANRLFEKWGIGKKGSDNGVLLFLTIGERRVRIEVGYGLEGVLTDAATGRILDDDVVPEFRRGDYSAGLLAGTRALAGAIASDAGVEITGAVRPRNTPRSGQRNPGSGLSLMQLLIIFLLFGGARWLWPLLFASGMGRRGPWGGGFGGFGGGFGGGGFGGGGFGGFGGGGSGGGGAGRGF